MSDSLQIKVSPNFTASKLESGNLDDKIEVFGDQFQGWVLSHALALVDAKSYSGAAHSGIAALMLASIYFEAVAQWRTGSVSDRGRSKALFTEGFLYVFPEAREFAKKSDGRQHQHAVNAIAEALYAELRCSLFHGGIVGNRVLLSAGDSCLSVLKDRRTGEVRTILINPVLFVHRIQQSFSEYLAVLRNEKQTEARRRFEMFWNARVSRGSAWIPSEDQLREIASRGNWFGGGFRGGCRTPPAPVTKGAAAYKSSR